VDATPGEGAVFTVEIPAADTDVAEGPGPEPAVDGEPEDAATGDGPEPVGDVPSVSPGGGDEHLAPSVRR
jgi:hypothetical protein